MSHRRQFTREKKFAVLDYVDNYGVPEAAKFFEIDRSNILRWVKLRKKIMESSPGSKKIGCGRPLAYPVLEVKLACRIRKMRKKGLKVSRKVILKKANALRGPSNLAPTPLSIHWLENFMRRHNFVLRKPTRVSQRRPGDMEGVIRQFHKSYRQLLEQEGPFEPSHIVNCDETPLPFSFMTGHTIDVKGAKQVWLRNVQNGAEKRFCTVVVSVFGDGVARMGPKIIFRGSGERIKQTEKMLYHPRVSVTFQKNAWADENEFLKEVRRIGGVFKTEKKLLIFDAHRAHMTEAVKSEITRQNMVSSLIPPGCTGDVQVLDVAFNKEFKSIVAEHFEQHLEKNVKKWAEEGITASQKRVLVTQWVGKAWMRMHPTSGGPRICQGVLKSFRHLGFTLKSDGSEDEELNLQSLPGYRIQVDEEPRGSQQSPTDWDSDESEVFEAENKSDLDSKESESSDEEDESSDGAESSEVEIIEVQRNLSQQSCTDLPSTSTATE